MTDDELLQTILKRAEDALATVELGDLNLSGDQLDRFRPVIEGGVDVVFHYMTLYRNLSPEIADRWSRI